MRDIDRSYTLNLKTPTALLYLNGAIVRTPRAMAFFLRRAPRMLSGARATEGCIQAKSAIVGPREFVIYSYWRDEAALRRFYTTPLHVELMQAVFEHPDWFTLYNETYALPVSARYWNAPNGYALSQPPQTETAEDWQRRTGNARTAAPQSSQSRTAR